MRKNSYIEDLIYMDIVGRSLSLKSASVSSGISIATLSRKISELEKRLNVKLFFRTSKGVFLTDAGEYYLQRTQPILHDVLSLENDMKNRYNNSNGIVKISMPVDFCISFITPIIKKFSEKYPSIKIDLDLSPVKEKLHEKKLDISIRLGSVDNMAAIARPVGIMERNLFVSPSYLSCVGSINHPDDLKKLKCIIPSYMKDPTQWTLQRGNEVIKVNVSGVYSTNNIRMMLKLAEEDGGVAVLTPEIVQKEIEEGKIVRVLKEWSFSPLPVYIVTETRHITQSARLFIEYITKELKIDKYPSSRHCNHEGC